MSRLPTLGPRGEGWVLAQGILLVAVVAGGFVGPAWTGAARVVSTIVGLGLLVAGAVLAVRGIAALGPALTPLPYPRADANFVESGVYGIVRHPIYGGLVLGATGWALLTAAPPAIALAVALFAFLDLKSRREEAWLLERYPGYAEYRRRTRRLIPGVH